MQWQNESSMERHGERLRALRASRPWQVAGGKAGAGTGWQFAGGKAGAGTGRSLTRLFQTNTPWPHGMYG